MDEVIQALSIIPHVEELYEVTGEPDIVSIVEADSVDEFRTILKDRIMKIKGVTSNISSVVLYSHKGPYSNQDSSL
jgi:DNA-binding Lrp family transcriptional regulator